MFQSKLKTQTHLVLFIWELERFDILSGSSGFRAFTYWLHCALTARLQTAIVLGREIFFFFFWIRNNLASAPSLEKPFSPWPLIFLSGGTQQRVDAVLFISSCLSSHNYPLIFRKGVCRKQGGWERWETDTPPREQMQSLEAADLSQPATQEQCSSNHSLVHSTQMPRHHHSLAPLLCARLFFYHSGLWVMIGADWSAKGGHFKEVKYDFLR